MGGLPPGPTTTKLYGNSTEAVQLYMVGPSAHRSANFTVTYRLMQTSTCQPHGLNITVQGWANWPTNSRGTLSISFRGAQVGANSTRAAFGGQGGTRLVFDWSDSVKANPAS